MSPSSPPPPFPWATVALVALISAGLGALGAWNLLPPERAKADAAGSAPSAPPMAAMPSPPMLRDAVSLGNWYYDQSQWSDAIRAYEQAIGSGTDNADIRTDLGNSYRFGNQPQKAIEQYQRAQQLDPAHENSLFNEAALYANVLHDHEKATAIAKKFLERFPHSASASAARQLMMKTD